MIVRDGTEGARSPPSELGGDGAEGARGEELASCAESGRMESEASGKTGRIVSWGHCWGGGFLTARWSSLSAQTPTASLVQGQLLEVGGWVLRRGSQGASGGAREEPLETLDRLLSHDCSRSSNLLNQGSIRYSVTLECICIDLTSSSIP